jgi:hypothetical protein
MGQFVAAHLPRPGRSRRLTPLYTSWPGFGDDIPLAPGDGRSPLPEGVCVLAVEDDWGQLWSTNGLPDARRLIGCEEPRSTRPSQ